MNDKGLFVTCIAYIIVLFLTIFISVKFHPSDAINQVVQEKFYDVVFNIGTILVLDGLSLSDKVVIGE